MWTSADNKVKLKESENKDLYVDIAKELKKTVERKRDENTNCNWCTWYCHQSFVLSPKRKKLNKCCLKKKKRRVWHFATKSPYLKTKADCLVFGSDITPAWLSGPLCIWGPLSTLSVYPLSLFSNFTPLSHLFLPTQPFVYIPGWRFLFPDVRPPLHWA